MGIRDRGNSGAAGGHTMSSDLRLSGAAGAPRSESDIRVNYQDTSKIVAASNDLGNSSMAVFYSSDGGGAWNQTSLPTVSGENHQADPAVDWTSDGTAWSVVIGVASSGNTTLHSFNSATGGATWNFDSTPSSGSQTAVDREVMWVDHNLSSPYRDQIYVTYHNGAPNFLVRRTAGSGAAWQTPVPVSGTETKGTAIGGDVKTNSFGDVFVFWPDTGGTRNVYVTKSTNGGASFPNPAQTIGTTFASTRRLSIPADSSRMARVYISGGAYRTAGKDLAYAVWADLSGDPGCTTGLGPGTVVTSPCKTRIWFSRSIDSGTTWSAPIKINDQASLNDQFHPRLSVDETSGYLVVIYDDTVSDPGRLKSDVWMQSSTDDGVTWSPAQKLTSAQTDETSAGADSGNQYGDYNGLTGYAGQFFACWTDRRSGGFEEIWGAPLQLVQRAVTFQIHRDHYGQDEVDAARTQPGGPVIKTGFWLAVDGFTARELGITGPGSTNLAPTITFNPATGVSATCTSLD